MPINDKIPTIDGICESNILDVAFAMPINVKISTIAGICEPDKGRVTVWPFFGPRWIWLKLKYMVV